MKISFTCACCGEHFESGWDDAEAEAEWRRQFGDQDRDDRATVCDGCYQALLAGDVEPG